MSTKPMQAVGGAVDLDELVSRKTVKKVAEYIKNRGLHTGRPDSALFAEAMKYGAGIKDAWEILEEADRKVLEVTKRKTGERPSISVLEWLAEWYDPELASRPEPLATEVLEARVFLKLHLIKAMIEGRIWVEQVGQNLVVLTDGATTYTLSSSGTVRVC